MSCNKFDQFGILFLYDELQSEDKLKYQTHLQKCDECRILISEFDEIRSSYKTIPESNPSRKTILKIAWRVRKQKIIDFWRTNQKGLFSKPRLISASVSLAIVVLIILFLIDTFSSDQNINIEDHLAWNNGVDSEIESIETDLDYMIYQHFSFIKKDNLLETYSTDTLSLSDYNIKKIDQDIDLLSWNYKQINF